MSLAPKPISFEDAWADLSPMLERVVTCSQILKAEWTKQFGDVYALCEAYQGSYAPKLYSQTEQFLQDHVDKLQVELSSSTSFTELLKAYHGHWQKYRVGVQHLNKLYSYLQSHREKTKRRVESTGGESPDIIEIGEQALLIWRRHMLEVVRYPLAYEAIKAIQLDRRGEEGEISPDVIRDTLQSFIDVECPQPGDSSQAHLEFYERAFEVPFLKGTSKHYKQKAAELITSLDVSTYVVVALLQLKEEELRILRYLLPFSHNKIMAKVRHRLVTHHLETLLAPLKDTIERECHHDLANLYELLKPLPGKDGLKKVATTLGNHIQEKGLKELGNLNLNQVGQYVETFSQFHRKYVEMVKTVFKSDELFDTALGKACKHVINFNTCEKTQRCKTPNLLAKYYDLMLRRSRKTFAEGEMDDKLEQAYTILGFIKDKDLFLQFYSMKLSQRLISNMSQSVETEGEVVDRLKVECGSEFTLKLYGILTDVKVSSDLVTKFNDNLREREVFLPVSFSVMVLRSGTWPFEKNSAPFVLPQSLESSAREFEAFYGRTFSGRKFTWLNHLSTCEVKLTYLGKPYTVTMSTAQSSILTSFEGEDEMSFKEISEATGLPHPECMNQLISLVKCKLLGCDDDKLNERSLIKLNKAYSNRRSKITISGPNRKETSRDIEKAHEAIDSERQHYVQATIVRIMKTRKVLARKDLVKEVNKIAADAGRSPSNDLVKKAIEYVLEREYIAKSPTDPNSFNYVE